MTHKFKILIIFLFFLQSCNTMSDAGKVLRNEKITNTDEFLVKKREPLTLPPDFESLPQPGSTESLKSKTKKIEEILNIKEENSSTGKSTTVEQSILEKIRQ